MSKTKFTEKMGRLDTELDILYHFEEVPAEYKLSQFQLIEQVLKNYIKELKNTVSIVDYYKDRN